MRTILNTVGTSLVRNASPSGSPDVAELIRFLALTDLRKASAETNALCHLLREDDALVFLHSETPESHLCAWALAEFFENRGHETRMVCVRDLSYREADFRLGLRALVGALVACIREEQARGREVLINATGGFKAEGAYATLVGLLFNVPVYYIYEAFQRVVQMPPLPIDWDYSVIAEHEDLLRSFTQEGVKKTRSTGCPRYDESRTVPPERSGRVKSFTRISTGVPERSWHPAKRAKTTHPAPTARRRKSTGFFMAFPPWIPQRHPPQWPQQGRGARGLGDP